MLKCSITGYTFCHIPPAQPMGATSLTCTFPEDISLSKKDFSVVHVNSTGKPSNGCHITLDTYLRQLR